MGTGFVTVKGEEFQIENGKLDLSDMGIIDISEIKDLEDQTTLEQLQLNYNKIEEIKGLEKLKNLRKLNLSANRIESIEGLEQLPQLEVLWIIHNQINEIKGLDYLTKLKELNLSRNKIQEIKGLENLTQLTKLNLRQNPVNDAEKSLVGKSAQEVVRYCQKKSRRISDTQTTLVSNIEKYVEAYDTIELKRIAEKFKTDEDTVEDIILDLIHSGRLKGNLTVFEEIKTFVKTKESIADSKETVVVSREEKGKTKYFSVPSECPHCGQFLTVQEYTWVDMMKVKCIHCDGVI